MSYYSEIPITLNVFSDQLPDLLYNPFDYAKPFQWDVAPVETLVNNLNTVSSNFDPDLSLIPANLFQSGIGFGKDLEFQGFLSAFDNQLFGYEGQIIDKWFPKVRHGTYYFNKYKNFLYPNASISLLTDTTFNGLSTVNLPLPSTYGIPISIIQYGYENEQIVSLTEFDQVTTFTGRVNDNGYMLDTTYDTTVIDITKKEFKVQYNQDWEILKERLVSPTIIGQVYNFELNHSPLYEYDVIFTSKDIFRQELDWEEWETKESLGQLISGDYCVGYSIGVSAGHINVYLTEFIPVDFGLISYIQKYPIIVDLNTEYLKEYTELLVTSLNIQYQTYHSVYVPLLDKSTPTYLDTDSTSVYVSEPSDYIAYPPFGNHDAIDYEWTRVNDLYALNPDGSYQYGYDEKIYDLNSDLGIVRFGGGSESTQDKPGMIPPPGYKISINYSSMPILTYLPANYPDYFIDPSLNLNPVFNQLSHGFLYLSSIQLMAAKSRIILETFVPLNPNTNYYDIYYGMQNIILRAQVLTNQGEPVGGCNVRFLDSHNLGRFNNNPVITNNLGYAYTTYDLGSANIASGGVNCWTIPMGFQYTYDQTAPNQQRLDIRNPNIPTNLLTLNSAAFDIDVTDTILTINNPSFEINTIDLTQTLVFVTYEDQPLRPFDFVNQIGGRWNILHENTTVLNPSNIVYSGNNVTLTFPSEIPNVNNRQSWTRTVYITSDKKQVACPYDTSGDLIQDYFNEIYGFTTNFAGLQEEYPYKGTYYFMPDQKVWQIMDTGLDPNIINRYGKVDIDTTPSRLLFNLTQELKDLEEYSFENDNPDFVVSTYSLVCTTPDGYFGGVLASNGDVHFIPTSAEVGQKISSLEQVSTYSLIYTTSFAYANGTLAPNGDIHFAPFCAEVGQKVNSLEQVSTYSLIYTTTSAYTGGVLALNGDVYFIPFSAEVGQKINSLEQVSTYSLIYTVGSAYWNGVLALNGDIHFIPFCAEVGQKVNSAGVVSTYSLVYTTANVYSGGVLASNGDIHFVPFCAEVGQKVDSSGQISTYSLVYTTDCAYAGGVLAPNGDIHFIPCSAEVGQKINSLEQVSTYSLIYTNYLAYRGGVLNSNGNVYNVYFAPFEAIVGQKISYSYFPASNYPYKMLVDFINQESTIVQYNIVSSSFLDIYAEVIDTVSLYSNTLRFQVGLPNNYYGIFNLNPAMFGSIWDGVNYLLLNELSVSSVDPVEIFNGCTLKVYGSNFPTDRIPQVQIGNTVVDPSKVIVYSDTRIDVIVPELTPGWTLVSVGPAISDKAQALVHYS